MAKLSSMGILPIIAYSLFFLLLGSNFIIERTYRSTPEYPIGGDTTYYVSMIEGNWITTPAPFKFRILVPLLASLLPFHPTNSLKLISYISLFFCYIFIFLTCRELGLNTNQSAIGLLSIWSQTWHLYNYHNPFLIDMFALLMICIMTYALLSNYFLLFFLAALLGILAKESTIIFVPVCLMRKEWRLNIMLIIISAIALIIPRLILSSETDATLFSVFGKVGLFYQPLQYVIDIYASWEFVWFLSMIGVWYVPHDKFPLIAVAYITLLAGAVFSTFVAFDTSRMFIILTPILAIASAHLFAELTNRKNRFWVIAFVILIVFRALIGVPNVILRSDIWGSRPLSIILLIVELTYVAFVLVALSKSLRYEVKRKTLYCFEIMRKPLGKILNANE